MIGKINKGKAFAPLVKYVLNPDKNARIVATNMCGVTPIQLIAELQITQDFNLRVRSPVCHISISFPIGERVSDQTLGSICRDYLSQMGFDNNPYFVAIHEDTDHLHTHIVTSRIKWSGQCVPDWKDYHKSETILRQLEKNYQLTPVIPSWDIQRSADTTGEIRRQRKEKNKVKSVRRRLQDAIDAATENGNVSVSTLFEDLQSKGIEIEVTQTSFGLGVSFSLDDINLSGTNLGVAYTWNGLQKHRNVNYDPLRDQLAIQQAMEHRTLRLSRAKKKVKQPPARLLINHLTLFLQWMKKLLMPHEKTNRDSSNLPIEPERDMNQLINDLPNLLLLLETLVKQNNQIQTEQVNLNHRQTEIEKNNTKILIQLELMTTLLQQDSPPSNIQGKIEAIVQTQKQILNLMTTQAQNTQKLTSAMNQSLQDWQNSRQQHEEVLKNWRKSIKNDIQIEIESLRQGIKSLIENINHLIPKFNQTIRYLYQDKAEDLNDRWSWRGIIGMVAVFCFLIVALNGVTFQLIAPKLSDTGLDYLQAIYQRVGWSNTKLQRIEKNLGTDSKNK